jgi:hypothetical protein
MSLLRCRSLRLCGLSLIMLLVVLSSSHYAMLHRRNVGVDISSPHKQHSWPHSTQQMQRPGLLAAMTAPEDGIP